MDEIYPGRSILMPKFSGATPHLWIILTEPEGNPPQVVIVNLTTLKPDTEDRTVILNVGDHPFIAHETVVYYVDARLATAQGILQLSKFPGYGFHDDCSKRLLEIIRSGLLESKDTPKGIKAYCRARFVPPTA